MKKILFTVTSLFLAGIIVLLILVFATETNPFNLSQWFILTFSGFALSISSYIVYNRFKYDRQVVSTSVINFVLIIAILLYPQELFDATWNIALAVLIIILGIAIWTIVPTTKSILNSLTKISITLSFLLLAIICIGKLEFASIYHIEFYAMTASSLLLLISVLATKSRVIQD